MFTILDPVPTVSVAAAPSCVTVTLVFPPVILTIAVWPVDSLVAIVL